MTGEPPKTPEAAAEDSFHGVPLDSLNTTLGFGRFHRERASNLGRRINGWRRCLISLGVLILIVPLLHKATFHAEISTLKLAIKKLNINENQAIDPQDILILYYLLKAVTYIFLIGAFGWCARVFSHLRRMRMVHLDKYIMARTFEQILLGASAMKKDGIIEEAQRHALREIFTPSLQQADPSDKNQEEGVSAKEVLESLKELVTSK